MHGAKLAHIMDKELARRVKLQELKLKPPGPELDAEPAEIHRLLRKRSGEVLVELDIVDWVAFACDYDLELFRNMCQDFLVEHGIEVRLISQICLPLTSVNM